MANTNPGNPSATPPVTPGKPAPGGIQNHTPAPIHTEMTDQQKMDALFKKAQDAVATENKRLGTDQWTVTRGNQ